MTTHSFLGRLNGALRLSAASGVVLLLALSVVPDGSVADRLALMAVVALGFATAAGWLQLLLQGRRRVRGNHLNEPAEAIDVEKGWPAVFLMLGALLVATAQRWFQGSTVIAAGDETLPNGTAWTKRLFESWVWSGSNLGGPGALQLQLPWAVVVRVVTAFGGSEGLAQRLWLTALFAGVGLAGVILVRAIGLHPIAGFVGGFVYAFNPFTLSSGGGNVVPVFLATQIAIALLAAIMFAVARERIGILRGAMLIGGSAPLLGFVFQTPPQLGIAIVALPSALGMAWLLWGRDAAVRCFKAVGLGVPLLLGLSAYWVIPATLQIRTAATELLSSIDTWRFTEIRATLGNAFWLNTHWTWSYPDYVPYAANYGHFPLRLVIYLLPAALFSVLLLRRSPLGIGSRHRNEGLGLAVPLVTAALLVIFISTGTEFPAAPVFTTLYGLPFGWLLREPGRFLVFNSLIYALLAAILVTQLARPSANSRRKASATLGRVMALANNSLWGPSRRLGLMAGVLCAIAVSSSYPLLTGEVIPDLRGQSLPSAHVRYPPYWDDMASYLNSPARKDGAVLVLPLDDFYQMPYSFGFYGSDTFITNLIDRHVLLPVPQGYFHATPGLASAVTLAAAYLRNRDWANASRIISILGVSYVLVRGDVTPFPGRSIDVPQNYSTLYSDPLVTLDRISGPLALFAAKEKAQTGTRTGSTFWTVDLPNPDPHLLAVVPTGVHLVGHGPIPGVPALVIDSPAAALIDVGPSFVGALAGPVQDCAATFPHRSQVTADVVHIGGPRGASYLKLTSVSGIACVAQPIPWNGGPLLIEALTRHLLGDSPHICVLEEELQRCAAVLEPSASGSWSTYSTTVYPDPGTASLTLYLTAGGGDSLSINEYANVRVSALRVLLPGIGEPSNMPSTRLSLTMSEDGYSDGWAGPAGGEHVIVDGLFNGWIMPSKPNEPVQVYYTPAALVAAGYVATVLSLILWVVVLLAARPCERIRANGVGNLGRVHPMKGTSHTRD